MLGELVILEQAVEKAKGKVEAEASDFQEKAENDDKKKKKAAMGGIIFGVFAAALAIGGIIYCKCNKKCCFEEKEDLEGGQRTDKTIFKKEVKSKNSNKRHTKESLMPSFKVAEQEA